MAKFEVGSRVVHITSGQKGTVVEVMPARRGRQLYKVGWPTGIEDELEVNLSADCDISDPFERCKSGIFGSYSEYSKKNTTFKIKNSNNSTISSLKASKTLFRAYQFKPLLKFLNSPNRRLLVADEVGLGKTIEAGHIMLELKARRELRNVLIVCPLSLQEKWKGELKEKFGLAFKVYDSAKDLITDLNDRKGNVRAIVNYEKIRMKRNDEEKTKPDGKKQLPDNLIDFLVESPTRFSLVLCDEAHKMRNSSTQTYKGAEIIMSLADAAVFLTATPVMISTENLYNLLHLLDNTQYFNYQIFDNLLELNRPFVEAITDLNHNVPLPTIAAHLDSAEIRISYSADENEIFSSVITTGIAYAKDPVYQEIKALMAGEDSMKVRARLQYLLSSMSLMNNVFSRTRKREVTTDLSQAERKPHPVKVELSDFEQRQFDAVIEQYIDDNSYIDFYGEEVMTPGGALGLVQKKRQVASSVLAYLNEEEDLDKGIDAFADVPDAKFDALMRIVDEVFSHGTKKIVIFAIFRKTLKYLQIRFRQKGLDCLMIHGQIGNRGDILEKFKKDPNAHILLSSEVGSEGLDMQFCNSMVNYDLPWNPMVVEQRIGRIDRFGQQSPVVNIYNLIVADSIQEDIYVRLLDRIGIFRGTIGDMEAILDAPLEKGGKVTIQDVYNKLEKELYTSKLTPEERQRKIAEVERAIQNEREDIQHLEEGLTNTLTNDAYFKDEINRILKNNAYVTEVELKNYLESVIRQELTTCDLVEIRRDVYEFKMPPSDSKVLRNFLTVYQPMGEENDAMFHRFKKDIEDSDSLILTFNQQLAYDDRSLLYLNIYHPIIQACLCYFIKHDEKSKTSFCYALRDTSGRFDSNAYYMALYQLNMHRMVHGVEKRTEILLPLLYNVSTQAIETNQDIIDAVFSASQASGIEHNPSNEYISPDMIEDMRYDFAECISAEITERIAELTRQAESERGRNEQQTREYYKSRIDNYSKNIHEWNTYLEADREDEKERRRWEGAIRLAQSNIERFEHERDERLALINEDPHIGIEKEIISLNLINIL